MRTNRVPLLLVALCLVGLLAVGATRQPPCGDTFAGVESRLQPADPELLGDDLSSSAAADLSLAAWALTTGAPGARAEVVDAGGWTAYVDETEISRLGEDGSVLWTRPAPGGSVVSATDGQLGVLLPERDRPRVAVVGADGSLTGCEDLSGIDADLAAAQEIRHGDVIVHSAVTGADVIVAVLALPGEPAGAPTVAVTGWERTRAGDAPIVASFAGLRPVVTP